MSCLEIVNRAGNDIECTMDVDADIPGVHGENILTDDNCNMNDDDENDDSTVNSNDNQVIDDTPTLEDVPSDEESITNEIE